MEILEIFDDLNGLFEEFRAERERRGGTPGAVLKEIKEVLLKMEVLLKIPPRWLSVRAGVEGERHDTQTGRLEAISIEGGKLKIKMGNWKMDGCGFAVYRRWKRQFPLSEYLDFLDMGMNGSWEPPVITELRKEGKVKDHPDSSKAKSSRKTSSKESP